MLNLTNCDDDDDDDAVDVVMVTLSLSLLLCVAYVVTLICTVAFITNLVRCLNFLLFSSNVSLTVEQQKLFGVTDWGWCCYEIFIVDVLPYNGGFYQNLFTDAGLLLACCWCDSCVIRFYVSYVPI